MTAPRRWRRALAITGLAAGLTFGAAMAAGLTILQPERERSAATPADVGLDWEPWAAHTADGLRVAGWWMPAADAPETRPTVMFLHGVSASKAQGLDLYPVLHEAGYNVIAFDFRAHGESGGRFTTVGHLEVAEVRAALDWLAARPGFPEHPDVALLGWSMGAATAIRAAAKNAHDVRAVIADSSFTDVETAVGRHVCTLLNAPFLPARAIGSLMVAAAGLPFGAYPGLNAPVRDAARLTVPLLLVQGDADALMGDAVHALAEAAGPEAEVLVVPDAEHVGAHAAARDAYEAHVLALLARAFPDAGTAEDLH